MKKSIIAASAASLALAAMPVVGAFAARSTAPITDTLNISLPITCSMTRTGSAANANAETNPGLNSNASFTLGTANDYTSTGTYSATLVAGKVATIGTSTLSITCNDRTNGHSLTGEFDDLTATYGPTGNTATGVIPYSTSATANDTSAWNVTVDAATSDSIYNSSVTPHETIATGIVQATKPQDAQKWGYTFYVNPANNNDANSYNGYENKTVTLTYKVSTQVEQPAGSYTGDAVYTLTYGPDQN